MSVYFTIMNIPQKTLSLLAGASLLVFSSLSAVTTSPVGYVTETIKPAQFNLIGLNLSSAVEASGGFESADDISSVVTATTQYEIRKVFTVADIFGDTNEKELQGATAGNTSNADIIWIPDGIGYNKIYYNSVARTFPPLTVGWKSTTTGNTDASTSVLPSGFFIQKKGAASMATLPLPSGVSL